MFWLDRETRGHSVTALRDMLNKKLQAKRIDNFTSVFPLQESHTEISVNKLFYSHGQNS